MSSILLIGGHGHVARALTPLLTAAGHTVTAVIRNPDQVAALTAPGVEPVVADIETLDIDGFTALISGHDAVIWSAGAGGGNPDRTRAVDLDAAVHSMQGALAAGVRRYLMVSWSGSRLDHGVPQSQPFFHYAQAKTIADAVLRDAGLDYTIIAPGPLTHDEPTGVFGPAGDGENVPRADVAALTAAALADPASIGRTYRFNSGTRSAAEFLATGADQD